MSFWKSRTHLRSIRTGPACCAATTRSWPVTMVLLNEALSPTRSQPTSAAPPTARSRLWNPSPATLCLRSPAPIITRIPGLRACCGGEAHGASIDVFYTPACSPIRVFFSYNSRRKLEPPIVARLDPASAVARGSTNTGGEPARPYPACGSSSALDAPRPKTAHASAERSPHAVAVSGPIRQSSPSRCRRLRLDLSCAETGRGLPPLGGKGRIGSLEWSDGEGSLQNRDSPCIQRTHAVK